MSGHRCFSLLLFVFGFILVDLAFGADEDSNFDNSRSPSPEVGGGWFTDNEPVELPWVVSSEALYIHRSLPTDANLVSTTSAGGTVRLNANQFNMDYSPGWNVSLMRRKALGTEWDVECIYSSVDDWFVALDTVPATASSWIRYRTPIGTTSNASFSSSYRSGLHEVEVNARRQIGWRGSFLMGFRYTRLSEILDILQFVPSNQNLMDNYITIDNSMLGVQMGYEGHIFSVGRLSVDGFVKAGVYNNTIENGVTVTQSKATSYYCNFRQSRVSFAGNAELVGVYKFNKYLSLKGGYQFLLLSGVGLASEQLSVSNPKSSTGDINPDADPFYHGGIAALEISF